MCHSAHGGQKRTSGNWVSLSTYLEVGSSLGFLLLCMLGASWPLSSCMIFLSLPPILWSECWDHRHTALHFFFPFTWLLDLGSGDQTQGVCLSWQSPFSAQLSRWPFNRLLNDAFLHWKAKTNSYVKCDSNIQLDLQCNFTFDDV